MKLYVNTYTYNGSNVELINDMGIVLRAYDPEGKLATARLPCYIELGVKVVKNNRLCIYVKRSERS